MTTNQEYLKPLKQLCDLVFGTSNRNNHLGRRRTSCDALLLHIVTEYMFLTDTQVVKQLGIKKSRINALRKYFIVNNIHNILSNVSYGIYLSYLNKLKGEV